MSANQSIRKFHFAVLLVLLFSSSYGQLKKIELPYKFGHMGYSQGLPENGITALLCDDQGLMWIGTYRGLYLFNGSAVIPYLNDPKDSSSIAAGYVWALFQDDDGLIYVGVAPGGLNVLNKKTGKFSHYLYNESDSTSISSNYVVGFSKGDSNHIWIGTAGGWLNLFDKKTKTFKRCKPEKSDSNYNLTSNVWSIYFDGQYVWFGTWDAGLIRFDPVKNSYRNYSKMNSTGPTILVHPDNIREAASGKIWVSGADGVNILDKKNDTISRLDFPKLTCFTPRYFASSSFQDSQGRIWIGTYSGLLLLNEKENTYSQFRPDGDANSISDSIVNAIAEDRSGNIWLSSDSRGVNILYKNKNPISLYHPQTIKVRFIKEAPNGKIWVATDSKINSFNIDSQKFNPEEKINKLLQSVGFVDLSSIALDQDTNMWIGSFRTGLCSINMHTMTIKNYKYSKTDSLSIGAPHINIVIADRDGLIWIGTSTNGIYTIDPKTQKIFHYPPKSSDSLSDGNILNLYEDHGGIIWVATWAGGLNSFDKNSKHFTHYYKNSSSNILPPIAPMAMLEDSKNRLWIGTENSGLYLYDREKKIFYNYGVADGLPNNSITGILEDDYSFLWISTEKGLCRFAPTGTKSDIAFKTYDLSDGILGYIFGNRSQCKTKDGLLLFGGSGGMNVVSPLIANAQASFSSIVFTDFKLFGKHFKTDTTIGYKKLVQLNYRQNFFTVEFSSINYSASGKNFYGYQLEGLNDSIIPLGENNSVSFTNVDPGEYVIKVWLLNDNGIWNDNYSSFKIIITPPFWKTKWFYALSALALLGFIFLFIHLRTRTLMSQRNQLELKVDKRTRELKEAQLQLVQSEKMASLGQLTAGVAHEINNPINFVSGNIAPLKRDVDEIMNLLEIYSSMDRSNYSSKLDEILKYRDQIDLNFTIKEIKSLMSGIEEGSRRTADIVKGLRNFSRLDEEEMKKANIHEGIESTLVLLNNKLNQYTIEVVKSLGDVPEIDCYPGQLNQVFMNLLTNAIDAVGNNGKIFISTSSENNMIKISIRDTGKGMSNEVKKKIFDPFFTTKDVGKGTGLGLSISYGIIEKHNGKIEVKSEIEKGTEFIITLPLIKN